MAMVALVATATAILILYHTASIQTLNEKKAAATTLAGLMEVMAQFEQRYGSRTHPQGSRGATMSQIERAMREYHSAQQAGELLIAQRAGNNIHVLRHSPVNGKLEMVAELPLDGQLAEPARRALNGERGGDLLPDYAGRPVLAGYAPVPSFGIGVVYKIGLAEMRAPYLRAALWSGVATLLAVGLGALVMLRIAIPAQRRMELNEKRLRAILAATPVGVFETDIQSRCTYANDQWCALTGLSAEQACGEGWARALHPADHDRVMAAWDEFVSGEAPFQMEYRFLRPDGSEVWVYGHATILKDASGALTGYSGTVTDISAQKGSQQMTAEALTRLNDAQRLAKVGSWELDLLDNHLVWSDEIFRMFEVDQTKFGASYEAFLAAIHPDDRAAVNQAYTESLISRKPYEIVHRLKMADGRIKYVHETCESFFDASGKPLRSVGTVQDISELHRAEMELRRHREHLEELVAERTARLVESERQLRHAQAIARLGHWSVNLESGELVWSDEIYRIFGRDPAEFHPSYDNFFACVHPDDRARVKESEQQSFRTGRHSIDHRVLRPDGAVRWVHEEAELERNASGTPLRLTGTVQDITDRKRTEADLVAARDAAERASRAKSDFLSRMSHELRTPMNAILGFSQVLELEDLKPEQMDFVREIHHAGDHLLELINELLDLSRIEAGKLVAVLEPLGVRLAASDAVHIVQPLLSQKRIHLINSCDERATVLADPTRLRQILVNLLSNAAKYNREGGQVQIACQPAERGRLRIAVTDTGPGLPPEKLASLFRPFERLGAEFSAVDGTGIGLALSKQLAELMGADLGVDSAPGQGSTFWVDLPQAETAPGSRAATDRAAAAPETVPGALKVLYVEDNPANLKVVEAMFRYRPGLRLFAATNGEYGLELARRYKPDVILLDIHLPGMDGYAVLAALGADPVTRDIPVIALSADAMPIDIESGLKAGFRRYLAKPVKVEELLGAITMALESGTTGSR
jgi:PAS domain S-box-containing protein